MKLIVSHSKAISGIKRVIACLKYLKSVYKYGGYAPYQITTIQRSNLLQGKRILITGGSSGIGYAIAKRSIEEGANVVITGRDADKLTHACESISSNSLHPLVWDVSEISSHEKNIDKATDFLHGELDILVNNAGILIPKDFLDITEQDWNKTYDVNSKGLYFLTQRLCSRWLSHKSHNIRKIINVSSQGGFVGATYPYRMTKWDIIGLTQGLALKLAKHGILVNGIAPGVIATEMQPDCMKIKDSLYYEGNPLNRFALPEEIAELAIFMISDASNFLTGQTIVCDGGFSIK